MSTFPYRLWLAVRLLFATRPRQFHDLATDCRVAAFDAGFRHLMRDVEREQCKMEVKAARRRAAGR